MSDLFHETDVVMVGLDRHSDGASDVGSLCAAAAVDAAVGAIPAALVGGLISDVSEDEDVDAEVAASTFVPCPSTPSNDGDADNETRSPTPASPGRPVTPSAIDDDEVVIPEDLPAPPRVRPTLQPGDIIAAIHCTTVTNTVAVANRLRQNFDVGSAAAEALPTVVASMHLERADLARSLRDVVVQRHLAGVPAAAILDAAVRRLETVLQNSEVTQFQSTS